MDDVTVTLGERSARAYASQGQQRALVLGWKIAEIENLEAAMGFLPLLLLDDVSSELDPERNAYLMNYLAQSGAQVFLTTTDAGAGAGSGGRGHALAGSADGRSHERDLRAGAISPGAPADEPA